MSLDHRSFRHGEIVRLEKDVVRHADFSDVMDERGEDLKSTELAQKLEAWRDGGKREARFLIGAADGHAEQQRREADLLLSFGSATWPHLLVRAMLTEQLFRATSILANHPYHREG